GRGISDPEIPFDLRLPSGEPLGWSAHPIRHACEEGRDVTSLELVAVAPDGREVPILANAAPLPNADGSIGGAGRIFQDIPTLKEVQRIREEWTAIVAHDLCQPVSTISLGAQALLRRRGDMRSEDANALERIQKSAENLSRMINDLLDYAQIEA